MSVYLLVAVPLVKMYSLCVASTSCGVLLCASMGSTYTGMDNELPVVVHLLADSHTLLYVCDLPVNGMVLLPADSHTFL